MLCAEAMLAAREIEARRPSLRWSFFRRWEGQPAEHAGLCRHSSVAVLLQVPPSHG